MDDWDWRDHGNCPRCGAKDYGFEMSDERGKVLLDIEEHCYEDGVWGTEVECEPVWARIRIERIWDAQCSGCGGSDWRAEWRVSRKGKQDLILDTEDEAWAVARALREAMGHDKEKMKEIHEWEIDEAEFERECAAERRMGC